MVHVKSQRARQKKWPRSTHSLHHFAPAISSAAGRFRAACPSPNHCEHVPRRLPASATIAGAKAGDAALSAGKAGDPLLALSQQVLDALEVQLVHGARLVTELRHNVAHRGALAGRVNGQPARRAQALAVQRQHLLLQARQPGRHFL